MMDSGFGGWLMTGAGFLVFVVLILAAAAVIKDVIFPGRSNGGRRES